MHTQPPSLTADELDDLLYLARVNEKDELQQLITSLAQNSNCQPKEILQQAQDPESGNTILHYCSANGFLDLVQTLLSLLNNNETQTQAQPNGTANTQTPTSTALINTPNVQLNTPLHWASLNGHLEVVKLLVSAGADVSAKNSAGHSAAFEAERAGKGLVVEFLLEVSGLETEAGDLLGDFAEVSMSEGVGEGENGVEVETVEGGVGEGEAGPSG